MTSLSFETCYSRINDGSDDVVNRYKLLSCGKMELIALTGLLLWRRNVFPVRYELELYDLHESLASKG
jgi:hypothetical protein